jgi:hypothetical protein
LGTSNREPSAIEAQPACPHPGHLPRAAPPQDASWQEVLTFFHEVEQRGGGMPAAFSGAGSAAGCNASGGATVASEARALRRMFLKLRD